MNFTILEERMHRELSGHTRKMWLTRCACGHTSWRNAGNIRSGKSTKCKSCAARKHGLSHTPEYAAWCAMLHRCNNPKSAAYKDYGGRGITVAKEWLNFDNFLHDMGPRPDGLSLERVNNDLGYNKNNCVWATKVTQQSNRRGLRLIEYLGKSQTAAAWSRELGISQQTITSRLVSGWSIERAFTTKPKYVKK